MRRWLIRHRAASFYRNSLWFLPLVSMAGAVVVIRVLDRVEAIAGWHSTYAASSVATVLGSLASAVFTLIVFVASALLITMQLASAQLTPRVIGLLFRDGAMKGALAVCVFAFTLTLAALLRVQDRAPALTVQLAAWSCVGALVVFLFLIDHVGRALRPSGTLLRVTRAARAVIERTYPETLRPGGVDPLRTPQELAGEPLIVGAAGDGVVMAFDGRGLAETARRLGAVVEMVPQVGDFVSAGGALLRVYGGKGAPSARAMRDSVALGPERTLEQDPAFGLRIVVDIACKALSPAVNDPTTAVLAIDSVHELLGVIGARRLDGGCVVDDGGRVRVLYRTPQWPEFVQLAVTEIRQFGADSIQVARRLHSMLDHLIRTLPEERAALLREELAILTRTIARRFPDPEDSALASVGDPQGVGGVAERMGSSGRALAGVGARERERVGASGRGGEAVRMSVTTDEHR